MRKSETDSQTGLVIPGPKRFAQLFARALTLRCPNCGGGPVLQHWFRMRERCGRCGLRIERGERDYFIGSMLLNLVLGELLVAFIMVGVILASRPRVPWEFLEIALPAMAVLFPVLCFPFSKLTWLALDLLVRPVTAAEMAWHDAGGSDSFHRPPTR